MKESAFTAMIQDWLTSQGAVVFKQHGNLFTKKGVPDILCCWRGHFVALEVKVGTNRATPHQLYWLDKIWASGGFCGVVTPKTWEQFQNRLLGMIQEGE